jgi:hypothetical protein
MDDRECCLALGAGSHSLFESNCLDCLSGVHSDRRSVRCRRRRRASAVGGVVNRSSRRGVRDGDSLRGGIGSGSRRKSRRGDYDRFLRYGVSRLALGAGGHTCFNRNCLDGLCGAHGDRRGIRCRRRRGAGAVGGVVNRSSRRGVRDGDGLRGGIGSGSRGEGWSGDCLSDRVSGLRDWAGRAA